MLQQTRVETVIPFFERFLARFPTVESLAEAELEEVLALWSGLGYYRRGRFLHDSARRIVAEGFPSSVAGLLRLPGIGSYTAAAIGSIAFGVDEPVLDGNVERVLSRYLALEEDPKSSIARQLLRGAARSLLVTGKAGDSNQALMELGATVCLPQRPRCLLCPLVIGCLAQSEGKQDQIPQPRRRRTVRRVRLAVAVVVENEKALMFRRPDSSELLAGTWELPWVEAQLRTPRAALEKAFSDRYGGAWLLERSTRTVRHSITHRAIEAAVFPATLRDSGSIAEGPVAGWFSRDERTSLPTSSLVGKVLEADISRRAR